MKFGEEWDLFCCVLLVGWCLDLMILGYIIYDEIGILCVVNNGNINVKKYIEIIDIYWMIICFKMIMGL